MVPVLSPSENPYDDQGHGFPAFAYQGEMEGVGLEISWDRQEAEEVDGGCFVRSRENHDVMGGDCEGLGEYPLDRNPSIPLDLCRHSLDHTSERDEAQGGVEWEGNEAQRVYSQSMGKGTACSRPTDEYSLEMVEVGCSRAQNEDQGWGRDKEGNGFEYQKSDEGEGQDILATACRAVHGPNLYLHVGCLGREPPRNKFVETSEGD